jgi:hypothetical protein
MNPKIRITYILAISIPVILMLSGCTGAGSLAKIGGSSWEHLDTAVEEAYRATAESDYDTICKYLDPESLTIKLNKALKDCQSAVKNFWASENIYGEITAIQTKAGNTWKVNALKSDIVDDNALLAKNGHQVFLGATENACEKKRDDDTNIACFVFKNGYVSVANNTNLAFHKKEGKWVFDYPQIIP